MSNILKLMNKSNAAGTEALIKTLSEEHQKYLKEIFQSKRITFQRRGEQVTVARRILKPRSRRTLLVPTSQ